MPALPPLILTNDDGFDAPGLQYLAAALEPLLGEGLFIAAPNRCYSGGSQQVTMDSPIVIDSRGPRRWAIGGSPADCARLALTCLAPECAVLVSGINQGGNMGHDIFLSGTVGAAREAALMGSTAVAVSHYLKPGIPLDWTRAADWTVQVLQHLLAGKYSSSSLWNVNLPHHEPGKRPMPEVIECVPCTKSLPIDYTFDGSAYHYEGRRYHERACDPGTDVTACFGGAIAVSRLQAAPH